MVDQKLYFSQYATNLVQTSIHNSLNLVENTSALAKDILDEAVNSSCLTELKLKKMEAYAEQLSLKIISQCISADIYATKAAQKIMSSVMDTLKDLPVSTYQKQSISKNSNDDESHISLELKNFVDVISSHIFYDAAKDLVKCNRLKDLLEDDSSMWSPIHNERYAQMFSNADR